MFSLAGPLLAALIVAQGVPALGGLDPFAPSNLYPNSVFKRAIPANPQLHPQSDAIVARFLTESAGFTELRDDAAGGDWNTPIYVGTANDPAYTVKCTKPWGTCNVQNTTVHIPAYAKTERGEDGHIDIVDLATGYEYNFWQAGDAYGNPHFSNNTLSISWGGRTQLGGTGLSAEGNHAGFAASAIALYPAELLAGHIDHALGINVRCADEPTVFPAMPHPTDGPCNAPNSPYYGMLIQLNMSDSEIDALNTSRYDKIIKKALAHYGGYVYDTGAPNSFLTLSYLTYTTQGLPDPWFSTILPDMSRYGVAQGTGDRRQLGPMFGGLGRLDWASRLRIIAPCVPAKTC
jgi:hypothetical protein